MHNPFKNDVSVKKFSTLMALMLGFYGMTWAQKVSTEEKSERLLGRQIKGYATTLVGTEIREAWLKYLREHGRVRDRESYLEVRDLSFISAKEDTVFSKLNQGQATTAIWVGSTGKQLGLQEFLHSFGVKYYQDEIQEKIDESERVKRMAVRQQHRLVNENKNLNLRLDNNVKDSVRLVEAIKKNQLERVELLQKLDDNAKAQDSVKIELEEIREIIEKQKNEKNAIQ